MTENFIAISDAATIERLARIIRDGDNKQCDRAFDDVINTHGRDAGIELWDEAIRRVEREQFEREQEDQP